MIYIPQTIIVVSFCKNVFHKSWVKIVLCFENLYHKQLQIALVCGYRTIYVIYKIISTNSHEIISTNSIKWHCARNLPTSNNNTDLSSSRFDMELSDYMIISPSKLMNLIYFSVRVYLFLSITIYLIN